jgi:hypothetical protein
MNKNSTPKVTAHSTRSNLLNAKDIFKIGYLNTWTMAQVSKQAQVCKVITKYGLDILGISECQWIGNEKKYLLNDNKHIVYSRRLDFHSEGVALLMSNHAEKSLIN